MDDRPLVSVLIPMRDEAEHVGECVSRVVAQTYGPDHIELLIADGRSVDGSIAAAEAALEGAPFARSAILDNPAGGRTPALNALLEHARGDIVVRVDCRALIAPDYVEECVAVLEQRADVGVVGGAQVARPRSGSVGDRGIARALNNRLTMGGSRYRTARSSGLSDTVWLGAFRRRELVDIGGWPRELDVNEDFELNRRYREHGRGVWFQSTIRSEYVPRGSLAAVLAQYFAYGRAKAAWWTSGQPLEARHRVLLAVPPAACAAALLVHRRIGAPGAAATVLAAAVLVDAVGTSEPAPPAVRGLAGALAPSIAGAWLSGIAFELLRGAGRAW